MDAKKFLEEWKRMCHNFGDYGCGDCPVHSYCKQYSPDSWTGLCDSSMSIDDLISRVEQWASEHPKKTRLDDFREKYPNARVIEKGLPFILPRLLGYCQADSCRNCPHYEDWNIKDCWDQEVQDGETD